MNGSTTLRLDAGPIALAGRGHSIFQLFRQTRRTSPADGTHGDPIESQHNHHGETGRTENSQNTLASPNVSDRSEQ
ncbi:hypothetical protein J6590_042003 [Homalodisca vitripennis]|nr:hypothetical protein J6590_042003 [Homalodisca vitripennis]